MKAKTTSDAPLRSGPGQEFDPPLATVPAGTVVTVLAWEGEWLRVRGKEGEGYLENGRLTLDQRYELPEVLLEELKQIKGERGEAGKESDYLVEGGDREERFFNILPLLHGARLSTLCLSGGGIRSATFNLGVLQGLARTGVLGKVDYLSTVSGGGYIGSWLSSWISREKGSSAARVARVSGMLAQEGHDTASREPYQVRFLRDYSNYLTPRVGIFSLDTWAIIGTYLRNLLLNWLVLIPLLFTFLLAPRFLVDLLAGGASYGHYQTLFLAAGALCGLLPIAYTVIDLPSIGNRKQKKGCFIIFFVIPLLLMACALSAYWGCILLPGCQKLTEPRNFVWFGMAVHVAGWVAGTVWLFFKQVTRRLLPIVVFLLCAAGTGALAGWLGWIAATKLVPALLEKVVYSHLLYATVSVPLILADYLLTGALMVALLSRSTGDQDREWWGRAAGIVILMALAWLGLMAAVIYGPWLILPEGRSFWKWIYTATGAGAGVAAALLGKNSSTPALRPGASMNKFRVTPLAVLAALFLLFLVQSLSLLATLLLWLARYSFGFSCCLPGKFACLPLPDAGSAGFGLDLHTHLYLICSTPAWCLAALAAVSAAAALLMGWLVNINSFSMHAMYRNRLVRCYLGASRDKDERKRNPFTGFDEDDDRLMTDLPKRPFHVVNMAWNLVKGRRLAWQQRKAASFTMTPLFAGSDITVDPPCKGLEPGGFRYIGEYGAGRVAKTRRPMTVGTAMAISGAAASPNMGYHSSPLVTFVMAFFNVRLGWWLGNPGEGMGNSWRIASPGLAVRPLLKETFGLTSEESDDIYLSDGGHFENLALYEMVRRRCRYIIACDAGCDCDTTFEDLGNAVRKVRADFGIEIDIDFSAIRAKMAHFAVGSVNYSCCDRREEGEEIEDGMLLYIKPVLTGDESADQFNYARMHTEFPHESTGDQWFDEAQFESYRKLGMHSVAELIEGGQQELDELFGRAARLHRVAVRKAKAHG